MKYAIEQIEIENYNKCGDIWDMKSCPPSFLEKVKKQIADGNRLVYALKIENNYIAEGNLVINADDSDYFIEGKRIYVSRMRVKKEYRNKGFGGIMLDYLIQKAIEMGYSEMALGVDTNNHSAIHLYRQKGFDTVIAECEDEHGKFYKLLKRL